ncbi:MAG: CRISPR-associated helicase Cas3' [Hyphomicrobiaceae bacterium]|nr:CRISPR-associated helicase Cas3' [Hyphomicrobiaceae bacterium]
MWGSLDSAIWTGIWAKTDDAGGELWHPLYRHALDVAAVADAVIEDDERSLRRHAVGLNTSPAALRALTLWLVALHDIGKATAVFQMKVPALWPNGITPPAPGAVPQSPAFHAVGTYWYLASDTSPINGTTPVAHQFEANCGGADPNLLTPIIDAIAGHHGRPVQPPTGLFDIQIWQPLIRAARELSAEIAAHFSVTPVVIDWDMDGAVTAYAWWLATLLPLSDWVGSNQMFFKPDPAPIPLRQAWEVSTQQAQEALAALGLVVVRAAAADAMKLLPEIAAGLSPVQAWAASIELPDGPFVAMIEDATGSGKTEAALMLAHRAIASGKSRGLFVALPTMATANAMYGRLAELTPLIFESEPAALREASLSLAHGGARSLREEGLPVAHYCAPWIAHQNRLAFFAQAGAGTIDQAVLSVLPSKYQTLRLRGLADKVLIIDEAHAFDAYVSEEVSALLRFHAAQGGSAILLSATLPQSKRAALARAFAQGANLSPAFLTNASYPLATLVADGSARECPLPTRTGTERRVRVARLAADAALDEAIAAARDGAAVAIIKTTVDSAIATRDKLIGLCKGDPRIVVDLFHARFLPKDRKKIETRVLQRFGKAGSQEDRAGEILVATQVIEQSLDIDFDVLITDLAPVDLLIQRAGRLWRHERGDARPSVISEPVLHVVSPIPPEAADKKWLDTDLPEARWVYRDTTLLWRTAKAIFSECDGAGEIVTRTLGEQDHCPGHPRRLVERVYAGDDQLPECLEKDWDRQTAEAMGETWQARRACLDPSKPYNAQIAPWIDDARVVTRLGDSVTVRLAQAASDGTLTPLASADGTTSADWADAEIRVSPSFARELAPPTSAELQQMRPPWREFEVGVRVLVVEQNPDGVWFRTGYHYSLAGLQRAESTVARE